MSDKPYITLEELDERLERDPGYVSALLALYTESTDENARLRARIAELEAAARPVPFSEREPERNQWVLSGVSDSEYWYPIQWPFSTRRTHWLPMPPAPEDV